LEIDHREAASAGEAWVSQHLPDQRMVLIPLIEKHMHPKVGDSGILPLAVFCTLAALVLLVACFNFASLAAGMSLARAREIGVRKVIGAARGQVAGQVLVETLLLSYAAVALAVALTEQVLPGLNRLLTFPGDFVLRLDVDCTPGTVLALLGIGTLAGLAAGAYPALVQSRLEPAAILRQRLRLGPRSPGRRLVVVQFVVAVTFLTTALLVTRQQSHWRKVDLGYDPSPILCLPVEWMRRMSESPRQVQRFVERLREAALSCPGVLAVTTADDYPIGHPPMRFRQGERVIEAVQVAADPGFLQTMGIRLLEGEDLPRDAQAGSGVALISRQLAQALDGPALGAVLESEAAEPLRVVGVVEDFQTEIVTEIRRPVVIVLRQEDRLETMLVRLHPADVPAVLAALRQTWNRLAPEVPFTGEFLQDQLAQNLTRYTFYVPIMQWLAGFLLFISGLGIFGLASFAVVRRTREVGVRKVFGASTGGIAWLLSAQFSRLILVALVFAWPLARLLSELLLHQCPGSRLGLDPLSYLAGAAIALLLTWLVSGYHTLRAARANPLDSLRQE
ncbi:MAG: FtsX-like permease family protein, partial [Candidatus Latescibacterota bacterium]